jgi:hypothetical protein
MQHPKKPLQHGTTSLRSRGWRRRRSRRRRKRREESLDPDLEGGRGHRSRSPAVTYLAGTRHHRLVSSVMEDAKQKDGGREREQEQRQRYGCEPSVCPREQQRERYRRATASATAIAIARRGRGNEWGEEAASGGNGRGSHGCGMGANG